MIVKIDFIIWEILQTKLFNRKQSVEYVKVLVYVGLVALLTFYLLHCKATCTDNT